MYSSGDVVLGGGCCAVHTCSGALRGGDAAPGCGGVEAEEAEAAVAVAASRMGSTRLRSRSSLHPPHPPFPPARAHVYVEHARGVTRAKYHRVT